MSTEVVQSTKGEPTPPDELVKQQYWQNHAKTVPMKTVYTKQAMTWTGKHKFNENTCPVVLLQCCHTPAFGDNDSTGEMKEESTRVYFELLEQSVAGLDVFKESEFKVYFDKDYSSNVFVSNDQKRIAVEHAKALKFDIFKDFNELEFFKFRKEELLGNQSSYFVETISPTLKEVTGIFYSQNKHFCAAVSKRGFQLFQFNKSGTPNEEYSYALSAEKPSEAVEQEFFDQKQGNAAEPYDRLMTVHLNKDGRDERDVDIDSLVKTSWAVFQSKMFSAIHFVRFDRIKKESQARKDNFACFGESTDSDEKSFISVKIDSENCGKDFFTKTFVKFSQDGSKAFIETPNRKYIVTLQDASYKYEELAALNKQNFVFEHGKDNFFYATQDPEQRQLIIKCSSDKKYLAIIDLQELDMNVFKLQEVLVFESTTKGKLCRVLGVEGGSGVKIYEEKLQATGQRFEKLFPSNLQAIRMPYIAYACGLDKTIFVQNIGTQKIFSHKLPDGDNVNKELQALSFTRQGTLFALMKENQFTDEKHITTLQAYKISYESNHSPSQTRDNENEDFTAASQVQPESENQNEDFTLYEKICGSEGTEEDPDISDVHIVDRKTEALLAFVLNVDKRVIVKYFKKNGVKFQLQNGQDQNKTWWAPDTKQSPENLKIRSLRSMFKGTFLLHCEDSSPKILKVTDAGTILEDAPELITKDMKIEGLQADEDMVYLLLQDPHKQRFLKVFDIDLLENGKIEYTETMFYPLTQNQETQLFVDTFLTSTAIIDGILISNENVFFKIYDDPVFPNIQQITDYLKGIEECKTSTLTPDQVTKDQKNRKIALVTEFTAGRNQCQVDMPRCCVVLPYLNDNKLKLSSGPTPTVINWVDQSKREFVYQLNYSDKQDAESKWTLKKFNLAGIEIAEKKDILQTNKMPKYEVLAVCDVTNKILATIQDTCMKELHILQIDEEAFTCKCIGIIEFKKNFQLQAEEEGQPKWKLSQVIRELRVKETKFIFSCNANNEFTIAVGFYAVPQDASENERELVRFCYWTDTLKQEQEGIDGTELLPPPPVNEFSVIELQITKSDSDLLPPTVNLAPKKFIGFELDEEKLIVWNREQIFVSQIQQKDGVLKAVDFNTCLSTNPQADRTESKKQVVIQEVSSRKSKQGGNESLINIKARLDDDENFLIAYDLTSKRQISHISGTPVAEFFYDEDHECYVYDQRGVFKLRSTESFFEYFIKKKPEENIQRAGSGLSRGTRMFGYGKNKLLLIEDQIVLPYSFFSYAMLTNNPTHEEHIENLKFYPKDYYKIDGRTTMQNLFDKPRTLEKALECYWQIDKNYILTVLVGSNEQKSEGDENNDQGLLALLKFAKREPIVEDQTNEKETATTTNNQDSLAQASVINKLIEMDHAPLINQILFMLSKLPIELSFQLLMPNFNKLSTQTRFSEYLSVWFESNGQLDKIQVVYVDSGTSGKITYKSNVSFLGQLDQNFTEFALEEENIPTTSKKSLKAVSIKVMPTKWYFDPTPPPADKPAPDTSDDFMRQEDQTTTASQFGFQCAKTTASLIWQNLRTKLFPKRQLVEISPFLNDLAEQQEIQLFTLPNMQVIIEDQWSVFNPEYWKRVFLPFFLCSYIPFIMISLNCVNYNLDGIPVFQTSALLAEFVLLFYLMYSSVLAYQNFSRRLWIRSAGPILNNLFIFITLVKTFEFIVSPLDYDIRQAEMENLRDVYIFGIIAQTAMLLFYIRVFNYAATFVSSLQNVIKASVPIITCLFFVIMTETVMFYVIFQSDNDGDPLSEEQDSQLSFLSVMLLTYLATIGDFAIIEVAPKKEKVFWFIFLTGTMFQLIIILNMVIAVMSSAFDEVVQNEEANTYTSRFRTMILSYPAIFRDVCSVELTKTNHLFLVEVNPVQMNLPPILMEESPDSITTADFVGVKKDIGQLAQALQKISKKFDDLSKEIKNK